MAGRFFTNWAIGEAQGFHNPNPRPTLGKHLLLGGLSKEQEEGEGEDQAESVSSALPSAHTVFTLPKACPSAARPPSPDTFITCLWCSLWEHCVKEHGLPCLSSLLAPFLPTLVGMREDRPAFPGGPTLAASKSLPLLLHVSSALQDVCKKERLFLFFPTHRSLIPLATLIASFPPATAVSGLCTLVPRSPWDQTSPRSPLCVGPTAVSAPRDLLLGCSSSEVTGSMWPLRHLAEADRKNVGSPGAVIWGRKKKGDPSWRSTKRGRQPLAWTGLVQGASFFFCIFFNWRIIALHNFVVFCHTSIRISHRYTQIPSLPSPSFGAQLTVEVEENGQDATRAPLGPGTLGSGGIRSRNPAVRENVESSLRFFLATCPWASYWTWVSVSWCLN